MKLVALIAVAALVGCVRDIRISGTLPQLYAQRESAHQKGTLSIVGVTLGIAAMVVGGVLVSHASDMSSSPDPRDDDAWVPSFLGGAGLFGLGIAIATGSTISAIDASRRYDAIDGQIRAMR